MSVITFELKMEHIALLRNLEWVMEDGVLMGDSEFESPFGGDDKYEDMGVIIYGMPDDFDPMELDPFQWTDEQKEVMDKFYEELPTAMSIVMTTGKFEEGTYITRHNERNWRKK
jgi:hypothetical protein